MSPLGLDDLLTKNVDPSAVDEVWHRVTTARAGRRRRRTLLRSLALTVFAAIAILVVAYRQVGPAGPTALRLASGEELPSLIGGESAVTTTFDDGSRITLARATALVPTANADGAVAFELRGGEATFDIVPHGPRAWTIDAGIAQVSVLGTKFSVARGPQRVRVEVERGIVRVVGATLPVGGTTLTAGQSIEVGDGITAAARADDATKAAVATTEEATKRTDSFDVGPRGRTPSPARGVTGVSASNPPPPPASARTAPSTPSSPPTWRPLASKGDFQKAYAVLGTEGLVRETDRAGTTDDLLRLADVARLSGHPQDAVAPLQRILTNHRRDPRSSLAAFTLGKLRQDALGEPGAAAAAFETAIALGVPEALREDAYARRVEAYAQAGRSDRAKAARAAYEAKFPAGRYREAVARWAP